MGVEEAVLSAFRSAAEDVPAYKRILAAAGVRPGDVRSLDDFQTRVPILDKARTFGEFPVAELCRGGRLGEPASVLTSSGHSREFAFGLYPPAGANAEIEQTDCALDKLFQVRSRRTLLVNCLPMGVRVPTRACTVGDTSVRPDMATALVRQFGPEYEQIILVGETAFIKHVLELGLRDGVNWRELLVHVIAGEELLAENARKYLEGILGIESARGGLETGMIGSSMGVAEIGLNLFFEVPQLARLRRMVHEDTALRSRVLGESATCVPMLFTYDPNRIFVEVLPPDQLVVTTLGAAKQLPLIRYKTGDSARLPSMQLLTGALALLGLSPEAAADLPIILFHGRGQFVRAGEQKVSPEQVKEGLYADPELAKLTTANFRLRSGPTQATVRIQLAPNVRPGAKTREGFAQALHQYVRAPLLVKCEAYESFGDGMSLDYERKFDYLEGNEG